MDESDPEYVQIRPSASYAEHCYYPSYLAGGTASPAYAICSSGELISRSEAAERVSRATIEARDFAIPNSDLTRSALENTAPAELEYFPGQFETGDGPYEFKDTGLCHVGTSRERHPRAKAKEPEGPEFLSGYYWSTNHPQSTYLILGHYHKRVIERSRYFFVWGCELVRSFVDKYFVNKEDYSSFFHNRVLIPEVFYAFWEKVDKTKSPGSPLVYTYSANHQVSNDLPALYRVVDSRLELLRRLGETLSRSSNLRLSKEEHVYESVRLIAQGYTDPVLLGVKSEPRAKGKIPRLVSQVSVQSNMVARILLGNHLIEEQSHDGLPVATSLDLTTPSETRKLYQRFRSAGVLSSSDVQGWEWAMDQDDRMVNFYKWCRCMDLIDDEGTPRLETIDHFHALLGYAWTLIHRVVQLGEGDLYVTKPGEMSSGELSTFSDNSCSRSYSSECVADWLGAPLTFCISGGDDNLDTNPPAKEVYECLGKVITDYEKQAGDYYTFCSTRFYSDYSYQENIEKSAYAILKRGVYGGEYRSAFELSFHRHPRFDEFLSYFKGLPVE